MYTKNLDVLWSGARLSTDMGLYFHRELKLLWFFCGAKEMGAIMAEDSGEDDEGDYQTTKKRII